MSKTKKQRNQLKQPIRIVNNNAQKPLVKLDINKPLFPQLVYWPIEIADFEPIGEFKDQAHFQSYLQELTANINWICMNKATFGEKWPEWIYNFTINVMEGRISRLIPTSRDLPKTKFNRALVVGNGPSADFRDVSIETLAVYQTFSTWHGANRLRIRPDYVIHSSAALPDDIPLEPFPSATTFIGEPTTNPEFWRLADKGKNPRFLHLNPENKIDEIIAGMWEIPCGLINQGSVATTCINHAIQCGHTDITLIGVDLTGPGSNEVYKALLEDYPPRYPHIKFKNASSSKLSGFENIQDLRIELN